MRIMFPKLLLAGLCLIAVVACGPSADEELHPEDQALLEGASDAAAGPSAANAGSQAPGAAVSSTPVAVPVEPMEAVEAVELTEGLAVGSSVGPNGAVTGSATAYPAGAPVHASIPVSGQAPGTEVTIYWFSASGDSVKTESKKVTAGAGFVAFELTPADGLAPGTYTAQVDIGGLPVGLVDFTVR